MSTGEPGAPPKPRARMARWKKVALGCGCLVVGLPLMAIGAVFLLFPKTAPASSVRVPRDAATVRRGEYLYRHVADCEGCHSHRDETRFGMPILGVPGRGFGTKQGVRNFPADELTGLFVPNITPHPEHGIGGWSDGEILRAIREGVAANGRPLFMVMPYSNYREMSDEDAYAIVAYMRSLPSAPDVVPESSVGFPLVMIQRFPPRPLDGPVRAPPRTDRVAYGRYLATIASCIECHTPRVGGERQMHLFLAGGQPFRAADVIDVRSANLTPDPQTGLRMTEEQFVSLFQSFRDMSLGHAEIPTVERGRNTVMPWLAYGAMEEDDLRAIYAYLASVPAIRHRVATGIQR